MACAASHLLHLRTDFRCDQIHIPECNKARRILKIKMNLSLFDYHLPNELIAQEPAAVRDASRLMVVDRKTRSVTHAQNPKTPKPQAFEILVSIFYIYRFKN